MTQTGKQLGLKLAGVFAASWLGLATASAVPMLQLDIGGGSYVGGSDQSIHAQSTVFDLYALYTGTVAPSGTFYISVAIQPKQSQLTIQPNFGTFIVNGVSYSSGLNYGLPPLDVIDGAPKVQDLGSHDVYPTYYAEIAFTFDLIDLSKQSGIYNTAENPGGPQSGTGSYYQKFTVDISGLLSAYSLHFDLYNQTVKDVGAKILSPNAITMGDFAPYSHDAQSGLGGGGGGGGSLLVPDGGTTIILLGLALLGVCGLGRKFAH